MINLILFGPPGSGKGTQAEILAEKFNLLHISTGALFREAKKNKTALGLQAKSYMDKGELVPDEVTINMLIEKLDSNQDVDGYIFDGYPRTVPQSEALDKALEARGEEVSLLIELEVPDAEIVNRLKKRADTSGRVDDANEDIIRNRIKVYKETTTPVADYYDTKGKTYRIPGVGGIDEISEKLAVLINEALIA